VSPDRDFEEIEGQRVAFSNRDKVLYPKAAFTKGEVLGYYMAIAPVLLPHLAGRPLTLKRYPNGVDEKFFYQKQCPPHPDFVRTQEIWSRSNKKFIDFCVCDNQATLAWLANLADIELHTSMSRVDDTSIAPILVFDFDPGPPATIVECCEVALLVRTILAELSLEAFPKTSGSKGMQLYVPLNGKATYDDTKGFAQALARLLEQRHPDLVLSNMKRELRPGKVLIDWSQNDDMKTTISVYSLRARDRPTVSTPLRWTEVEKTRKSGKPEQLVFEAADVLRRVKRHGDLFAPVQELQQELPDLAAATG
jgi:bifunctional non-homologous end joining protein LigD